MAINHDWVHNQACSLSHCIHVVSHLFITFNNLLKLITKRRLCFIQIDYRLDNFQTKHQFSCFQVCINSCQINCQSNTTNLYSNPIGCQSIFAETIIYSFGAKFKLPEVVFSFPSLGKWWWSRSKKITSYNDVIGDTMSLHNYEAIRKHNDTVTYEISLLNFQE